MTVRIRDFTTTPGARYRHQGSRSGEEFRKEHLEPALDEAVRTGSDFDVDMRGTDLGAPVGFLEEAFGGLVRSRGLDAACGHLRLIADGAVDENEIRQLMLQAEWCTEERRRYADLVDETPEPGWAIWDTLLYAADAAQAIQWIQMHEFPQRTDEIGAVYLSSLYEVEGERYAGFRIDGNEVVRIDERTLPVLYGAVVAHCVQGTRRRTTCQPGADRGGRSGGESVSRLRSADGRRYELVNENDTAVSLWSVDESSGTMEQARVNDATRDALWTIAQATGLVPGAGGPAAPAAATGREKAWSTNGRVAGARRRRLQRWAERIAAWHTAWRMLDARTGGSSKEPSAFEMHKRGLWHSSSAAGEEVAWRPYGEPRTVWSSATEVYATALGAVLATSARACGWQRWWNERIEADRFRAVLADPDVEPGQLVIEGRLVGGAPREPALIDGPEADRTVEWESPEDNWKGEGERKALQWMAGIAATAAATRRPAPRNETPENRREQGGEG